MGKLMSYGVNVRKVVVQGRGECSEGSCLYSLFYDGALHSISLTLRLPDGGGGGSTRPPKGFPP